LLPIESQLARETKKNLLNVIKRSKSKEGTSSSSGGGGITSTTAGVAGGAGSMTQRNVNEELKFS